MSKIVSTEANRNEVTFEDDFDFPELDTTKVVFPVLATLEYRRWSTSWARRSSWRVYSGLSMTLKIACQMDPIESIDIRRDSAFALLLEAQSRGCGIFYYTTDKMALDGDRLMARGYTLRVRDQIRDHFQLSDPRRVDLSTFDVILLRQDPPFDMAYITATHLLERIYPKTLVVNNPREVRNAPEKLWVLDFLDLMPPTLVTRNPEEISDFYARHKDIVIKPLFGSGGAGVFRVQPSDTNLSSLIELFHGINREPLMVQRYCPEVRQGDKRIILVDGEIAGAINRIPATGETRSNMHVGGKPVPTMLTSRDKEICARLGPHLKQRGLIFAGIDVIGPHLTEINITSPTGVRQVKAFGGNDIVAMIWDVIERKVSGRLAAQQ